MRRVQLQGCLPTLLFLVILAGILALAVSFGLAIGLVTSALVLLAGLVKAVRGLLRRRGLLGARPGRPDVETLPPGWAEQEPGGPVVEAERPSGDGERNGPPRG